MRTETITRGGKKFILLTERHFHKLVEDAEMLADIRAFDAAKARLARGEDELIPASMIMRRLDGENPVKIWREYRAMTQEKLATLSGVSRSLIGAIESGHKKGSVASLKKLAKALKCDLENIA